MAAAAKVNPNATAGRAHHRQNSDELDVFEAASYFSGYGEVEKSCAKNLSSESSYLQKVAPRRAMRMSLDESSRRPILRQSQGSECLKDKVTIKQPSSPGGKLASFLNSIFSQTNKKKTKPSKNGEEKSGGGRRKRRSSISHFATDSMTVSDSCKPFTARSHTSVDPTFHGHRYSHVVSLPSLPLNGSGPLCNGRNGSSHPQPVKTVTKWPENKCIAASEGRNYRKSTTHDDGADSDSSSDLFELQNYDVDMKFYPAGVPIASTALR